MIKQFIYAALFSLFILAFSHCAQIAPLGGGKRDVTPPKLVEAMPLNQAINFNSGVITLKFDEYVKLKDLSNQLIITPKFKTAPEISADGKKIQILLKREELLPNTTYRIFFGSSIIDMNEGNAIPDFDYVFSTGNFIDSLKIKGTVLEAFNNKPAAGALLALYNAKENKDSLPYLITPDYVTKTGDNGNFVMGNMPYGRFKAFAFLDKNKNNLYDGEIEKIAFMKEDLTLMSDTNIKLNLFQEIPSKAFIKKTNSPYYGLLQIILNKKSLVNVQTLNPVNRIKISETLLNKEKDTVTVFYKDITDTLDLIMYTLSSKKSDTIKISLPKNNLAKKRLKSFKINAEGNNLALNEKLKLSFLNWMDTSKMDLSKIKISSKEDSSIVQKPIKGKWLGITTFELNNLLKEGINYTFKIDSGTFFDVMGFKNDSGTINFKTKSKAEFGKVTLKILFSKKQNYLVQLINEKEQVVKEQAIGFSLSSSNAVSIDFIDVSPGIYTVKVIYDDNENKKWDSGNFLLKQQAEHVFMYAKQLKVLSDWEMEEEILIKE
jgi:hypothetical protein